MNVSPASYMCDSSKQLYDLCKPLRTYGKPGHEVLELRPDQDRTVLATTGKGISSRVVSTRQQYIRDPKKVTTFVLNLLEENNRYVVKNHQKCFGNLGYLVNQTGDKKLQQRYHNLLTDINERQLAYHNEATIATLDQAIAELERAVAPIETIEALKMKAATHHAPDTVLECLDGLVHTQSDVLEGIAHFERYFVEQENRDQYHINLRFAKRRTVEAMLAFLTLPENEFHHPDIKLIGDLYWVVHHINYRPLMQYCFEELRSNLPQEKLFEWFPLLPHDFANEIAAEHFGDFCEQPQFLTLNHERMIELLKMDNICVITEDFLFEQVIKWAENRAQHSNERVKDILYFGEVGNRIIDYIRIDQFYKMDYFVQLRQEGLLDSEVAMKYFDHILERNEPFSKKRNYGFSCRNIDDRTVEVTWIVPEFAAVIDHKQLLNSPLFKWNGQKWKLNICESKKDKNSIYICFLFADIEAREITYKKSIQLPGYCCSDAEFLTRTKEKVVSRTRGFHIKNDCLKKCIDPKNKALKICFRIEAKQASQ